MGNVAAGLSMLMVHLHKLLAVLRMSLVHFHKLVVLPCKVVVLLHECVKERNEKDSGRIMRGTTTVIT